MQTDRGMERRSRKREVPPLAGDGDQARAYCDGCRDARAPHGERRSLAGVPLLRGGHQVPARMFVFSAGWKALPATLFRTSCAKLRIICSR